MPCAILRASSVQHITMLMAVVPNKRVTKSGLGADMSVHLGMSIMTGYVYLSNRWIVTVTYKSNAERNNPAKFQKIHKWHAYTVKCGSI